MVPSCGRDHGPVNEIDVAAVPCVTDDVLGGSGKLRTFVEVTAHRVIGAATVDFQELDGTPELVTRPHRDPRRA